MTISAKLGPSYEAVRAQARIKTITVSLNDVECELKVRIPVKREMDEMTSNTRVPIVQCKCIQTMYCHLHCLFVCFDQFYIRARDAIQATLLVLHTFQSIHDESFQ